jgi:hypothetical protein
LHNLQPREESSILQPSTSQRRYSLLVAALLLACFALFVLRLDRAAGLYVDDAWYLLLAKALATGQGYQLINAPTPGIVPLFPPGYPFLLSLVYRLTGDFPANIMWLKLVSVFSLVGLGWLGYEYLTRDRHVPRGGALALAILAILSPQLVFFATSTLMAECLFALLVVAVVLTIERGVRLHREEGRIRWPLFVIGGILAAASYLTRGAGIVLLIGLLLYLLKERLWRPVLVLVLLFVVTLGPWTLYVAQHPVTEAQQFEQAGNIVMRYSTAFWQRWAGETSLGTIALAELPERVWTNFLSMVTGDTLKILAFQAYLWGAASTAGSVDQGIPLWISILSSLLFLVILVGYVAALRRGVTLAEIALPLMVGLILLWPFETTRFLLPLSLFFHLYLFQGAAEIRAWWKGREEGAFYAGRSLKVVLGVLLLLSLWSHGSYLSVYHFGSLFEKVRWVSAAEENEQLMRWISTNLPATEILVASNPALVHLATGHKTVGLDSTPGRLERLRRELGVRYVVLHGYYGNPLRPEMRDYEVIYRLRNTPDFRILDMGPAPRTP